MNIASIIPARRDVHVVPYRGKWAVEIEHEGTARCVVDTQIEAMAYGMTLAREAAVSLVIHGRNGRFRETWSYDS